MEHARDSKSSGIGLLLDQEKAYDCVHPVYLRAVLLRFGFPVALVDCISHLFFDNNLVVNGNGFLSAKIPQLRGLKQGDPMSPILFNLAFEPLLRKILQDPHLPGFQLPSPPSLAIPSAVKMMAYADDIVCLLTSPADLDRLQYHLHTYSTASNVLVNFHKTEAISLSGSRRIYDDIWRAPLLRHQITSWHDATSSVPIRYLGFPLYTSVKLRNSFLDQLLDKIRIGCQIHQQRGLSVRGRATVLNSLILSKLWHVLRAVTVQVEFLKALPSVFSQFVNFRISPKIGYLTFFSPRSKGGLAILNPQLQQGALQLRWLDPLLSMSTPPTDVAPFNRVTSASWLSWCPSPQPSKHSTRSSVTNTRPSHQHAFLRMPSLHLALDRIPKDFSSTVISAATCLELPLTSVVLSVSPGTELSKSYAKLPTSIAYTLDPNLDHCLRPKSNRELSSSPQFAKTFLRRVREGHLRLAPFFVRAFIHRRFAGLGRFPFSPVEDHCAVDASPFVQAVFSSLSPTSRVRQHRLSTRSYRKLCSTPPKPPPCLPPPYNPSTSPSWSTFWSLPLSHKCRTVWYRFLHDRIPHRVRSQE